MDLSPDLLAILAGADFSTKAGIILAAVAALSWLTGKGLILIISRPGSHRAFALGLKTANIPGLVVGKWLQAGPLHVVTGPILCLAVFLFFWLFTAFDRALGSQKPDVQKLIAALEDILSKSGSTDRKLYIQAKTLPQDTAAHVSAIAENLREFPAKARP